MAVDVLTQPLAQAVQLARGELRLDVRQIGVCALEHLPGYQVAERVRREVTDEPARPVHILEYPVASSGTSTPRYSL